MAMETVVEVEETKSYRKELKMKPSVAATIQRAASVVGMDMSTFMTSAAYRAAADVERAQGETVLDKAAFEAFAAAVDRPGVANPALARLFRTRGALLRDG